MGRNNFKKWNAQRAIPIPYGSKLHVPPTNRQVPAAQPESETRMTASVLKPEWLLAF